MLKIIYITVIIIYGIFFTLYLFRFEASYRLFEVNPKLIEQRSLTKDEYIAEKKAEAFARKITFWFMRYSFLVFLFTVIIRYNGLLPMNSFIKFIFFFSLIVSLILFIASNSNFVPMPPIR